MEIVFSVSLGNLRQQDAQLLNPFDPFLIEKIEYWSTLNYENLNFNSTQIWHSSLLSIDNRPSFYKSWFKAGVKEGTKSILPRNSLRNH